MGFKSFAIVNGASVFAFTSSTVTPSAISTSVNPSEKSTSNTHNSVIIRETQVLPVRGNTHSFF